MALSFSYISLFLSGEQECEIQPDEMEIQKNERKVSVQMVTHFFFLLWPSSAETLSFSPRPSQTCLLIILHTIDINKDGGHVSTSFNCKNSEAKIFQL